MTAFLSQLTATASGALRGAFTKPYGTASQKDTCRCAVCSSWRRNMR
jgi:hypothetical protein